MITFEKLLERANSGEEIAVHTATEDQAAVLLNELDKRGYKWASGIKLTDATIYEKYREKTCYEFNGYSDSPKAIMYGPLNGYQYDGCTIIEFSDINFKEEKEL